MPAQAPCGSWTSPLTADEVTAETLSFGPIELEDGTAYWLEHRPSEDGRGVVLSCGSDGVEHELTPTDFDVRTLAHEYGGGDFTVHGGTLYYARFADQRLYRQSPDTDPEPITPEPRSERSDRYADSVVTPDGQWLYCVRERHDHDRETAEPITELIVLPTDGSENPRVVASGHDFYAFPRVSPDGTQLAWTTWDHPRMPWDGTTLCVATIADDGRLEEERTVMGGPDESVFQPTWSPDGDLYAVSDRTGWWNLYRIDDGEPTPVYEADAEFGAPQWVFGLSTYAFLDSGLIAVVRNRDSEHSLSLLDPKTDEFEVQDVPFSVISPMMVRSDGEALLFVGSGPRTPSTVTRWTPGSDPEFLRRAFDLGLNDAFLSDPERIDFPTGTDRSETAHALYYPPQNPEFEVPADEVPPLVTMVHGGPTSQTLPALDPEIQFFTTRGVGVVDVNYRGSTGYGRGYRNRLDGEWGVFDTEDCVNAATYLADEGRVDENRLAIRGGSAGGYATLCALTFHDVYDAGVSYFGVADLRGLAEETHKFESRYLDGLVGPLPEAEAIYRERSPVFHAENVSCPLLLLQGSEDRVVPPSQAEAMVDALVENDVPYAYLEFRGERHGFRAAAARRRALESEFSFYATVFDFEPADEFDEIELARGEHRLQKLDLHGR